MSIYFDHSLGYHMSFEASLSSIISQQMCECGISRVLYNRVPYLLGALVAIESYQNSFIYDESKDDILRTLACTTLTVEVLPDGKVSTSVVVDPMEYHGLRHHHLALGSGIVDHNVEKKRKGKSVVRPISSKTSTST